MLSYHHFVFHKISGDSLISWFNKKIAFKSRYFMLIYILLRKVDHYIYKSDMVLTGICIFRRSGLNDWNYVNLTTFQPGITWENMVEPSTYQIDSTKDLWYGYYVRNFSGDPVGMDKSLIVIFKFVLWRYKCRQHM